MSGIHDRYRSEGSHAYTLDEVDARIMACAADEAAAQGSGPLQPALFRELEGIFQVRLYRGIPASREAMAAYGVARGHAGGEQEAAEGNHRRVERRRRELVSQQMRLPRPVTGLTLSRPWFLAVCLVPAMLIEIIGSTPSVQEAFKLDIGWAVLFAIGISAVLVLTAEQLGNALAAATAHSRRLTALAAGLLLFVALGAGVGAIISLADSRETNLSFKEAVAASRAGQDESGRIGGDEPNAGAPAAAVDSSAAAPDTPTKPDFEFFVPLSILVLMASTLVAFRVEAAREHNELVDRIATAEEDAEDQRDLAEEKAGDQVQAVEGDRTVLLDVAAHVERECNLFAIWIARFEVEYERFCAAVGKRPRHVTTPPLPDVGTIILQILQPLRGSRPPTEAEAEAITGVGGNTSGNGNGNGAGPGPDGADPGPDGDGTGGDGVVGDESGDSEPEPPRPPPPLPPCGESPRTSFDETGRPANLGWVGKLGEAETKEDD
ncbi:MAG TPA: hypothetical protein VGO66_12870 [Solirubrobacterales bacterium]|nr:hypothetical protein [Solirubrobacterales bacterium]